MNDPKVNLNMSKTLKFDMNDPKVNLNMLEIYWG